MYKHRLAPYILLGVLALSPERGAIASIFDKQLSRIEITAAIPTNAAAELLPDYPAKIAVDGETYDGVTLHFAQASIRNSDKPSFELLLKNNRKASERLGTTHLRFETGELRQFSEFAVSKLAERISLPTARVGHAMVRFNQRGLGLYVVVDQDVPLPRRATSSALASEKAGDLPELLQTCSPSLASNVLFEVIQACLDTNLTERLARLEKRLDIEEFYRLMAFESIVGDPVGYVESGNIDGITIDTLSERLSINPKAYKGGFQALRRPVLTRKRSIIANALMKSPGGLSRYIQEVDQIVSHSNLQARILGDIDERYELLESVLSNPLDRERLQRSRKSIQTHFSLRFAAVADELKSLPSSLPPVEQLPLITSARTGRALPVRNPVNYGAKLSALIQTNTPLTSSVPIHTYSIALTAPPGTLENLSWRSTNWVTVDFESGGTRLANVGLRLKGHGTRQGFERKPSFTLKFNYKEPQQSFNGQKRIHVQSSRYDSSYLNYFIGSWLFRKAHLPAAEIAFAEVSINGKLAGTFVVSEGITKDFLKREFGAPGGLLYEGELADLNGKLDLDSGTPPPGYSWPGDAYRAAEHSIMIRSLAPLKPYVDMNQFGRFCALEVLLGHRDGYLISHSNYRIYQTRPDSPLVFIPHGMDNLSFDLESLFPPATGRLGRALLETPEGRELYLNAVAESARTALDMDALVTDAAVVSRSLQPLLRKLDPQTAKQQIASAVEKIRLLGDRKTYLEREIQLSRQFHASTPN